MLKYRGMSFAEHLRVERTKHNLSAEILARNCGISRSYVTLIENGKRLPSAKLLPKIAEQLGLKNHVVLNWYLEDVRSRLQRGFGT